MASRRSLVSIVATVALVGLAAWLNTGDQARIEPASDGPAKGEPATINCDVDLDGCRAPTHGKDIPLGKGFDYYVLALSWSPTWCADNDPDRSSRQCDPDEDFGFIVHGLWPNRLTGEVAFCPRRDSDRVPDLLVSNNLDIMPSAGLIGHQWRKHGTCSGLSQADYFTVLRAARNRVSLPVPVRPENGDPSIGAGEIRSLLVEANPGLPPDGVLVTCEGSRLDEIRFCLTPDLAFRDCPANLSRGCIKPNLSIPPVP